jgi:glycerophosphoryl diester phosphodiesterase
VSLARRDKRRQAYLALPRPALFGHRGVRTRAPENTLAAFEVAADEGADGVEIDVRPSKDGELVVMHDATLARMTGDPRLVAELTTGELAELRVAGEVIPTLRDTLAFCGARGLALNIELKRDVPSRSQVVLRVARLLARTDVPSAVVVSSFDPWMLAGLRALAPEIPTALLLEPHHHRRYRLGHMAQAFGMAVHPARSMVTPLWLDRWHRRGLRVMVWTVNDPEEIRRLCAMGVDGIITDDPGTARAVMPRRSLGPE